ncbi:MULTISPECIES: carbohydrate ABC transporter permease [Rhizobium]|uniref:ABC transporter permease n=2 Tax=Rhizobium TaxID=379 RepID=A0A109JQE0_9HYPH|nr:MULTISPECIES: sugar ABC transporter permease [Rhizobium]KWV53025.1 ABC transporter permease [Rhizobium altiplani]
MTISQTVTGDRVAPRRRRIRMSSVFWFTLPAAAIMLLVLGVPLVYSFYYSFTGWSLVLPGSDQDFIGLLNYTDVLGSSEFWAAIRVTLIYAVVAVSLECALGILFAVLLNMEFFGRGLFRSLMLIPMVITPAVVGIFWKLLYEQDSGVFNYLLGTIGLEPVPWLGLTFALASVIIMDFWQSTPFFTLIILAGLQSLDRDTVSAAQADGANALQVFRYLTLPHLVPYITIAAAFRIIGVMADFDKIFLLTLGGPGNATTTLSVYAYNTGFKVFDIGRTTAISWIYVVFVLLISAPLIWRLFRGASVNRH